MSILSYIMWYIMGFGLVMAVASIITAPFYLIVKHGEGNVSMYAVFAAVDAILTLIVSVILLPNCDDVICGFFAMWLIPTMIFCFIGAVIVDRITAYINKKNGEDE